MFPLMIMVTMNFVFSQFDNGVNPSISNQQFLANCPLPIGNGIANLTAINNGQLVYTINYNLGVGNTTSGTMFNCFISNNLPAANTIIKPYGAVWFGGIFSGWYTWVADTVSQLFGKMIPYATLAYLYITLPGVVSGIIWFNLVTGILLTMVALGIILAIRGGSG